MKYATRIDPKTGKGTIVSADGKKLGSRDVDRPLLHVLPKLFVPVEVLEHVDCDGIELEVTSSLPVEILPEGGAIIRQPYPNRRYFVGGSALIRNGWIVPLPEGVESFEIEFRWRIFDAFLAGGNEWMMQHMIHIRLLPGGDGKTYSMDSACWPNPGRAAMYSSPISVLGLKGDEDILGNGRMLKEADLVLGEEEILGFHLEEWVSIPGIPFERAWSIDAFEEEQIHEVKQTAILQHHGEAHRANAVVEMPVDLFVEAVTAAGSVPFDSESEFAHSVAGERGGLERHPAMDMLCQWWEKVRPQGEPYRSGFVMPWVRVRDDGEYWCGYYETPNAPVEGFNPGGASAARIGDQIIVIFLASQEFSTFGPEGMSTYLADGRGYQTIGISQEQADSGECDEAWYSLKALAGFRRRFPEAWKQMEKLADGKNRV
jgi:hypothetical protein